MEPNNQELNQKEKFGWLKMFIFFVFGTSGLIASAIAAIWIFFRTKIKKKQKYYAVAAGLIFSIVGSFAVQQFIFYKAPETKEIKVAVDNTLDAGRTNIGLSVSKTITNEGSYTTNSLSINHFSRAWLTAVELQKAGIAACEIIEKSVKEYDIVEVVSDRSTIYPLRIPFYQATLSASFPCPSWSSEEALNQLKQLENMMNRF